MTKLIEGHEYNFKVFASNEIGESDPCVSSEPIKAKLPFGAWFVLVVDREQSSKYILDIWIPCGLVVQFFAEIRKAVNEPFFLSRTLTHRQQRHDFLFNKLSFTKFVSMGKQF